eukprot:2559080-Amphidinium_carterae.1
MPQNGKNKKWETPVFEGNSFTLRAFFLPYGWRVSKGGKPETGHRQANTAPFPLLIVLQGGRELCEHPIPAGLEPTTFRFISCDFGALCPVDSCLETSGG